MLPFPSFSYEAPRSLDEALRCLSEPGSIVMAGGTDLLPSLKHRLLAPSCLVSLRCITDLKEITTLADGSLAIGSGISLRDVSRNTTIQRDYPALALACRTVATPTLQGMATLGGNILLDTRCLYYNQTEFWRRSLGYCLKAEGTWCHVVGGPKTCVAAQSSDTVPVLLALDATLELLGPTGLRTLPIRDLYRFNGMDHLTLAKGELLTAITIAPPAGLRGSYQKLRTRDSIDFPQLGVAIVGSWDGPVPSALTLVIGAANPQPKPVRGLEPFLGVPMDAERAAAVADLVFKQTRPQESVHGDAGWRRQMAAVFTRRGLLALADAR